MRIVVLLSVVGATLVTRTVSPLAAQGPTREETIADQGESAANLLPTRIKTFDGPIGGSPPDTEIAVSTRAVVTALNHQLTVFNKADGAQRLEILFTDFFPKDTNQDRSPYDPHIEYDDVNGKFIIVTAARQNTTSDGYLGLIIGKTSNPTSTSDWCSIHLDLPDGDEILFLDYPGMSINPETDLLILTVNVYDSKGTADRTDDIALGARVLKLQLSTMYNCPPVISTGYQISLTTRLPGTDCNGQQCLAESLHPAQWLNNFSSEKLYLISHHLQSGLGTRLYIWSLENNLSSNAGLGLTTVDYNYQKSPGIRQIGGQTLRMNNSPFISHAYYKNNTLYATQDVKNPSADTSAVVLHKFPLDGVGTSTIRDNPNRDYAFQSVMLDDFNNIALGFSQTQFVGDPINFGISFSGFTNDIMVVKENDANRVEGDGLPRGGDYSDAYLDPNGRDIWMINSYAGNNNFWRSKIFVVTFLPKQVFIPLISR